MYKLLFISDEFEPFKATWGAWAGLHPHQDGWVLPLGWEDELTARGIYFEVIEVPEPESPPLV